MSSVNLPTAYSGWAVKKNVLLLVLSGWAVDAAGAVGGGAAPDALVAARTMAVLARGRVDASGTVARRSAPFAVLLVVAMLMLPRG